MDQPKRMAMDLWVVISILAIVVAYHFCTQFNQHVQVYMDPQIAELIANGLFIWLIGLLWIAYERWKKVARRGMMLEDIFLSTGDEVLLVVGPDQRITMCNDAVRTVFGHDVKHVIGKQIDFLFGDRRREKDNPDEIAAALRDLGFHRGEAAGKNHAGEEIIVEVHTGTRKRGKGHVLMVQDITERKESETRLRKAKEAAEKATTEKEAALEKLEASYQRLRELEIHRDSLIHMVCHDMKAPLQVLILQLDLLKEMIIEKLDNDELESVDTLLAYSRQLEIMVHSMLDLSKLENGSLPLRVRPHDVRESLEEVVEFLKSMHGQFNLSVHVDDRIQNLAYDRDIVHRILQNLLVNAAKYSPPGGAITLRADHDGDTVRFSVADEGLGIPPEFHRTIFEKFGQVQMKGHCRKGSTGLGLAFSKLAVEAHGGSIGVDSGVGRGSSFWFTLPTSAAKLPKPNSAEQTAGAGISASA